MRLLLVPSSSAGRHLLRLDMRFVLIDRITELNRGQSLTAVKNLSLAEEYLADHFPGFPVMPGVLMLEALTQAGAWLIRDMEDFAHSVILLKQAKTIKYGSFFEPGRQLKIHVDLVTHGESETTFKGVGTIEGQEVVKGRFVLTRYNLRDRSPNLHATDTLITAGLRDLFATLRKGSVGARAMLRDPATGPESVLTAPDA
jgi:3-hydroxyacyl-[acyl-carrier-protein] dehydratase